MGPIVQPIILPPVSSLLSATAETGSKNRKVHPLIANCSSTKLAEVVRRVCLKNDGLHTALLEELLLVPGQATSRPKVDVVELSSDPARGDDSEEDTDSGQEEGSDSENDSEIDDSRKRKRLAEAVTIISAKKTKHVTSHAVCRNCNQLYACAYNEDRDCVYHDGDLEVNDEDDCWADHDEACYGTINSDELRCEYPHKYIWNCCDEDGEAAGCQSGNHRENGTQEHYARLKSLGLKY